MRHLIGQSPKRLSVWDLMNEMDRAFEKTWGDASGSGKLTQNFAPQTDIEETADFYLFSLDLPGIKKEDVKIDVNEGVLRISGQREETRKTSEKQYYNFERSFGSFERTFRLPQKVDESKIQASFENGVLEVMVPKSELSKPRSIQIESGTGGFFSKILNSTKSTEEKTSGDSH